MTYKRCNICYGYGKMMGGGMIQVPCDNCEGSGKMIIEDIQMEDDHECKPERKRGRPKRHFLEDD